MYSTRQDGLAFAQDVERNKSEILKMLESHPVELEWNVKKPDEYMRVVIDRQEHVDLLISQLRAEKLSEAEALNGSLVH